MSEELGKIEKPAVESFKKGRKLLFLPVIYSGDDVPEGFTGITERYWVQAAAQLEELTSKLGAVKKIYHELIDAAGEQGAGVIKDLNAKSYQLVKSLMERQAEMIALEDTDILTEYLDWNRCLMIGLQNTTVMSRIYEFYQATGKKRNEQLAHKIDETLKENEIGVLMMRENHQVQFPSDIQVFYIAPPALDEIKRFVRDQENKTKTEKPVE